MTNRPSTLAIYNAAADAFKFADDAEGAVKALSSEFLTLLRTASPKGYELALGRLDLNHSSKKRGQLGEAACEVIGALDSSIHSELVGAAQAFYRAHGHNPIMCVEIKPSRQELQRAQALLDARIA